MAESTRYPIPSLVGGISNQAPQSRTPSAAEDQINCIGSVRTGVESRSGSEVLKTHTVSFTDPFEHEIRRSATEHYKLLIENGVVEIFNLIDGTRCGKTSESIITPYLSHTGPAREAFDAVTVEDTTFIINKQKTVRMASLASPARPNKAIFYFKSGGYSTVYKATINVGSTAYTVSYTTPDNSSVGNAAYITTTALATSLRNAIAATYPFTSSGFTATVDGSSVIIEAPPGVSFTVESTDGAGDTHLISFKDWARKFADLPIRCVDGFVVGIRGSAEEDSDDYWLKYSGVGSSGFWQEVVKPEVQTNLDAATMPHVMSTTAFNGFTFSLGSWGSRICGDGIDTAKDPTFVNKKIVSAKFISGRLGLFTEGSYMLSRSRNAFVFFPDTAQTNLDTDPIGYDIATGTVTIIKDSISVSDKLFLWGDGSQIKVDAGEDQIKETTIEARPSSNYEYDGRVSPEHMDLSSAVFGTNLGDSNRIIQVVYQRGIPTGQLPLNDHCPDLIEGNLRCLVVGGTSPVAFAITDSTKNELYVYQWVNDGDQRVVSSWSRWTFPLITRIVGASIRGAYAYLLLQIGSKLSIERLKMSQLDREGIRLRLDHSINESKVTGYSGGKLTVELPYSVAADLRSKFVAVETEDSLSDTYRGRELPVEWVDADTIKITTDDANLKFLFGSKISSKRRFSQPYIIIDQAPLLASRLVVDQYVISHSKTAEYRVEVRDRDETLLKSFDYSSRRISRKDVINNKVPTSTGEFRADIGRVAQEVWVDLVNDSVFPSAWTAADLYYSVRK